jgi:hypothetical protein
VNKELFSELLQSGKEAAAIERGAAKPSRQFQVRAADDSQAMMDAIFREKVRRARQIPPSEKLFSGLELFEEVEARMRAGVRQQFPEASEEEVERRLRQRFARLRQIEEHGFYRSAP